MDIEILKQTFVDWMKAKVPGYGSGNADFTIARTKLAEFGVTKVRDVSEERRQEFYDNIKSEIQHGH